MVNDEQENKYVIRANVWKFSNCRFNPCICPVLFIINNKYVPRYKRISSPTTPIRPDCPTADLLVLAQRRQVAQQQDLPSGAGDRVHLECSDQLRPQLGPRGVAVLGPGGGGRHGGAGRRQETRTAAGAATRWGRRCRYVECIGRVASFTMVTK